MRSSRRPRKSMAEMNVVPYIDVMLVLLVIFMVTAPMMQMGVDIDMPDTGIKSLTTDNQQEPLIISVDQTGQYFLSDKTALDETELRDYITQQAVIKTQRPVRIRAAQNVEYHYVMTAVAAAERAGAKVGLMADPLNTQQ
uniref:Tol-Pal system protein TolR n=1 Tax=uncultured Thiotrichaceae bacterium TaxID=298394 RepID=A0A6S6TIY8_9GAMM|nr:MAG: Tol-Pal system protein TolR [uncultured Thiotrichaceae bacterium]